MNTDHDLHGKPTRPAYHVQRPFKSHETCVRHPCGQAGQPKASRLRDRHDNIKALAGRPSSCHPACLLFTITSEQDNGGPKASTIAISVSHLRMFRSTPRFWWSQTGSNRRPQACKASALPTELWPQSLAPTAHLPARPRKKRWWAWKDLNFRPHAYQARALTN